MSLKLKETRKQKIKIGDKVKIINPEFFVRCGYPLCLKDARKIIIKEHKKEIRNLIGKISNMTDSDSILETGDKKNRECIDRIVTALTRYYIYKENFGGKERQIFTETLEETRNKEYIVLNKFYKVTGEYINGSSGYSYEGEFDVYESAYLKNSKRHSILSLDQGVFYIYENEFAIEEAHVEKVL